MTVAQVLQARVLIPGAFEPNVPSFRDTQASIPVSAVSARPTTLLGGFAAVLGDVVLRSAVVLAFVAAAVLAVKAITAAVSFILETFVRS
jgi:hypothetical protein